MDEKTKSTSYFTSTASTPSYSSPWRLKGLEQMATFPSWKKETRQLLGIGSSYTPTSASTLVHRAKAICDYNVLP
jgi:hypothetical protein